MMANIAHRPTNYEDLDPRRVEGLMICKELWNDCQDLSPYLYKRAISEGKSPYIDGNRHFSLFGNRILAEHYRSTATHRQ